MTNVEFHLQLNHNVTWNMSRLHFHDHYELLLPLTSPGNIFVNDQVYPLQRGTLYLIGENTLHRTIATGFHARYILHIGRKALAELSTPQTDLTQLTHDSFRRAALSTDEMTEIIELFQALERNKNDGSFGSDIHHCPAQPADPRRPCPQRLHRRRGHPQQGLSAGGAHPGLYPGQPG